MRKNWTAYLSSVELLRTLCKWRAEVARKRAPLQRLWETVNGMECPEGIYPKRKEKSENDVDESTCLPSHRQWMRLGQKERKRLGEERVTEMAIFRTAMRDLAANDGKDSAPLWIANFKELLAEIEGLRGSNPLRLCEPTIHLIPKEEGKERRCLASFDRTADRFLLSKAALYLRDIVDPLLSNDCFAFRRDAAFSYRSAIEDVIRYRLAHSGETLYVAECDIQSFFDVINHDVALEAYDAFVSRLEESERPPDELRRILCAYLDAWTSRGNLMASKEPNSVEYRQLVKPLEKTGVFDFYDERDRTLVQLGVPQGGALSPLIANIVLDAADRAVRDSADPDLLYCRYCDDIIIVHTDRGKCEAALERYLDVMRRLKLPVHKVCHDFTFGSNYYDIKSKGPFEWRPCEIGAVCAAPWVSFLGVHIRYDGMVRVRKSSLEKHAKKLRKEVKRYKEAVGVGGAKLKDTSNESKVALLKSFEARLVAMGTGYSEMRKPDIGNQCWMAAFPFLTPEGPAAGQLKHLDGARGHQVAALKKHLGFQRGALPVGRKKFYGRPYSYYGALIDVERHDSRPGGMGAYSKW